MCPPNWFHFQGACYIAVSYEGDFYSAVGVCGDMGGFLAILDSIEDKDQAIEIGGADGFWLGASDEGHEGNWTTLKASQYKGSLFVHLLSQNFSFKFCSLFQALGSRPAGQRRSFF